MKVLTKIDVPATTANLGAGFDVFGLALCLCLHITVRQNVNPFELTYRGYGSDSIPRDERNLIWRTIAHVAARQQAQLPNLAIEVFNEISLGRGLGSSGAAIVAGVLIANDVFHLCLDQAALLDYALEIEPHPDNVTAAFIGGLVACCVSDNGHVLFTQLPISPRIKTVLVVPAFELATTKARAVLPPHYVRKDVVFNLQRVATLASALCDGRPEAIAEAMRDRIHQPYRKDLIPGLEEILEIRNISGLLGVSLSGAGPSVLALATDNFSHIGEVILASFLRRGIDADVLILDVDLKGATNMPS